MFKSVNGLAPEYLQSLFSQRRSVYNLRDFEGKLTLPKPSTNYLKRSFSYSGAMLLNNMPKSLKNAVSVNHFKRLIKKLALALALAFIGFPRGNHVKQLYLVLVF